MALRPQVLILSNRQDLSVDWVVRELRGQDVPFTRLNTETIAAWGWTLEPGAAWRVRSEPGVLVLDDVRSILYRRPIAPRLPGVDSAERALLRGQWRAVLDGLASLPGVRWINDPWANARAESKILQLALARGLGLRVPETLITNSREDALAFARACGGRVICKGLDAPILARRSGARFVFSTLLDIAALESMAEIDLSPVVLQRPILPKLDIRVTVVGPTLLAAATRSSEVDWRRDPTARFEPVELAVPVTRLVLDLARELGLVFAGVDLVRDDSGQDWFLESNPNGEWGWLQAAGLPIASMIATELAEARPT